MSRGVEFLLCNSEVVCIPLFRSRRRAATRYASNYNIVCRTLLHLTKTITSSYLTSSWVSGTGPATQTRSGCYQQPDCVVPYLKQTSPNNTVKHWGHSKTYIICKTYVKHGIYCPIKQCNEQFKNQKSFLLNSLTWNVGRTWWFLARRFWPSSDSQVVWSSPVPMQSATTQVGRRCLVDIHRCRDAHHNDA